VPYIKRIIEIGGDPVAIRSGAVYVNTASINALDPPRWIRVGLVGCSSG
jgi:hypothetical protein